MRIVEGSGDGKKQVLTPVPLNTTTRPPHFPLQLKHSIAVRYRFSQSTFSNALSEEEDVQKCLGGRRATGNVEIDGNDSVAASNYRVRVMVVTSSVRARSHGDDPSRLGHLIVDY